MDVDTSDLDRLVSDLAFTQRTALAAIRPVMQRTMVDTKKDLQAEASGVSHAPQLPDSISYDTRELRTSIVAEIGPKEGGVGSLALLYFGNSKTGPRLKDPLFAMKRQAIKAEPFFLKALGGNLL